MPPKKEKLSKVQYRELSRKYGIRLRGPVPRREWPIEHEHHFQCLYEIQYLRYEAYKDDQRIPSKQRNIYRERVKRLRRKACNLLEDININEATWRELEQVIFERFDDNILCRYCNHEIWKPFVEAECLHPHDRAGLHAKRGLRQMCNCKNKRVMAKGEDSDNECGHIFGFGRETIITHALDDDLHHKSISMKPDRVIGLQAPPQVPHSDELFPVLNRNLLLPFLVVEAKKEEGGPGFHAMQYQTAFPIRRLLKAQTAAKGNNSPYEPSLVWFFGYQGEQWRLFIGIEDDQQVKIYDLWQGTIQSQDGALQLLIIVDYIWSWARDVYRPTIRKLLAARHRDLSPASTDHFRHSVSLSCATSPAPNSQDQDSMRLDESRVCSHETSTISQTNRHQCKFGTCTVQEASSDPFLRWAVGHRDSPQWTNLGSIRHADNVCFEFKVYRQEDMISMEEIHPSLKGVLRSSAVLLTGDQLRHLAFLWARCNTFLDELGSHDVFETSLTFHTFCVKSTWQIQRVLSCTIWQFAPLVMNTLPDQGVNYLARLRNGELTDLASITKLEEAFIELLHLRGLESVRYALQELKLLLTTHNNNTSLKWVTPQELGLSEPIIETLIKSPLFSCEPGGVRFGCHAVEARHTHSSALMGLQESRQQQSFARLSALEPDLSEKSILAIRSPTWPEDCPQFCLFILSREVETSGLPLHQLLEDAIKSKDFYGPLNFQWNNTTLQTLGRWRKAVAGCG